MWFGDHSLLESRGALKKTGASRMRSKVLDISTRVSRVSAQCGRSALLHCCTAKSTATDMAKAFRKFLPMFDRVLVERLAAETVTKGGIMLPEKSQGKVLQATVVAIGPGTTNKNGNVTPVSVHVGEKVLLPEYGGTKVILDEKDYYLFRDADILGKYVD